MRIECFRFHLFCEIQEVFRILLKRPPSDLRLSFILMTIRTNEQTNYTDSVIEFGQMLLGTFGPEGQLRRSTVQNRFLVAAQLRKLFLEIFVVVFFPLRYRRTSRFVTVRASRSPTLMYSMSFSTHLIWR